tara:strand:- start:42 stop:413 length:372 start_codon:yes stop_codon:yes gene_type:complete
MSKENFEQFIEQIKENEELQSNIGEELDYEALIELGAESGYEFSAEDMLASSIENMNKLTLSWEIDENSFPPKSIKIDLTSVGIPESEKLTFSELIDDPDRFELKSSTDTILEGYLGLIRFKS